MDRRRSNSPTCARGLRRALVALLSPILWFSVGHPGLAAQVQTAGGLPLIEPKLTRIVGADTVQIHRAVLSPEGRWVVYSATTPGGTHLWVLPSSGGAPSLLVEDRNAANPIWFPAGDRIAYRSGGDLAAVMAVPFDHESGRAAGPPRRVTLDRVYRGEGFRISPDGKWIAYKTPPEDWGMLIKVIPANGGTARTIASERTNRVFLQDWSADGQYVYYRRRDYEAPDSYLLFRVAVAGGAPQQVSEMPDAASGPRGPYRIDPVGPLHAGTGAYEIQTLLGEPVARLALPENSSTMDAGLAFSPDTSRVLAVVSNSVEPLRVVPVAGGAPFQLGETRGSERPLGWTANGSEIFFSAVLDGRTSIMSAPVAGGAARELGPMPDMGPPVRDNWGNPIIFSQDGAYLSYSRPTPGSPYRTFVVRSAEGGEERVITESLLHHEAFGLSGPGGVPMVAGEDFLYTERVGEGKYEIRAVPPTGPSRLIRSFSDSESVFCDGVFEDRVVCDAEGPQSTDAVPVAHIMVARGPDGPLKEVAVLPGVNAFDGIVWSNDGKWIAADAYYEGDPGVGGMKVVVVGVGPEGEVTAPPRVIDTPMYGSAWSLRWLPDDSAVILYGQSLPDWGFDIFLIPVRNGGRPVSLTSDETDGVGYHVLSPDGRYVAYQAWVQRGTSLWLADLGNAMRRIKR